MSLRAISRELMLSKNTVRKIVKQQGKMPDNERKDKILIDHDILSKLYSKCEGRLSRIHEMLEEEHGINVGYSTLTRLIRELELGRPKNKRCFKVPDTPGEEMQHDTSPYKIKIGDKTINVIASILYFRYSKMRYLKFYRSFVRFAMKCFFHESLMFFGYSARTCIIDNTNLARLRGTGKNAIIAPEMEAFAKQYGFKFVCHEVKHCNRKAGNERSFYTLEQNFFPGRTFETLEDLNKQAFEWATIRRANKKVAKTDIIPAKAFEFEKEYLIKIPAFISPPYRVHERITDQYGYVAFNGNYYWIPGTRRDTMTVLEYSNKIKLFKNRALITEYDLPSSLIKKQQFFPKGSKAPKYKPCQRKKPTEQEEKKLRAASKIVDDYLNFLPLSGNSKHRFIRKLFSLFQKLNLALFIKTIERAAKYKITDIKTIERIVVLNMNDGIYEIPNVEIDRDFHKRDSYIDGKLTDIPDLSLYDKLLEEGEQNE